MDIRQDRYRETWEAYWSTLPPAPGEAFWDSSPEMAAGLDLPHMLEAFNPGLPVVDFGCGNGTQTRYLAKHFDRVVGVDVSRVAVEVARSLTPEANVTYATLDGTDLSAVKAFHDEIGDSNVYMRTVLHQMLPEHRPTLAASMKTLMGKTGVAYLLELSEEAHPFFEAMQRSEEGPPPQLARVLECGITPGLLSINDVSNLFSQEEYFIRTDSSVINTVHILPDGTRTQVPAFYAVVTPRLQRN